ncbi:hypothetical protein [Lentilitoribacter sp. EG35]|uniref:hypothetical protein n=1 Tax=Lentilitoribacter sp. EG35 TaxID=3234192 RepID=UPI0034616B3D
MRNIGQKTFIALEFLSYVALIIGLFAIINLSFFNFLGNCTQIYLKFHCDGAFYDQMTNLSSEIIFAYILAVLPILLGLLGVLLGLRRIHHVKTVKLRAEGRTDEVEKLRYFLLRSSKYLVILAVLLAAMVMTLLS